MTLAIGDDNHDVVDAITLDANFLQTARDLVFNFIEQLAEVTRSGQCRIHNTFLVGCKHFHGPMAPRVFVTVEVPETAHILLIAHVMRDSTKSVNVEAPVDRVLAHHVAHFKDGLFILVHLAILVLSVEGPRVTDF